MRSEFYTDGKELIGPAEWEKKILSIKSAIEEDLHEKKTAKKALAKELVEAVIGRVPPEKFGVLFSGGVDSSVIALILKNAGKEFVCYTLGFKAQDTKEPEDVGSAIAAAKNLGLKIRARIIDVKEAEGLIKMTVKILGLSLSNVVNVGVGAVVLGCAEMAKEDGVKFLFSGLGSEEIFAGYHRHKLASDRQEECWNGLLNMYERDLLRDSTISATAGFSILTPFLDERLMATAMRSLKNIK